jgi:hypothetical protein
VLARKLLLFTCVAIGTVTLGRALWLANGADPIAVHFLSWTRIDSLLIGATLAMLRSNPRVWPPRGGIFMDPHPQRCSVVAEDPIRKLEGAFILPSDSRPHCANARHTDGALASWLGLTIIIPLPSRSMCA